MNCLNPNHETPKSVLTRGLCAGCYNSARRLIAFKKTTWEQLESQGKCLRARTPEGKPRPIDWLLEK